MPDSADRFGGLALERGAEPGSSLSGHEKPSRIDVSRKGATATVEIRRAAFYPAVRRLRAVVAKLEVDPRMTESSDTSDTPAKPQDYAGLRAESAALADDFTPVITELWPRLATSTAGNCTATGWRSDTTNWSYPTSSLC